MSAKIYRFPKQSFKQYRHDEPPVNGAVELHIDWDRLIIMLGGKAAFNASHQTRLLGGAIRVKFIADKEPK